MEKYKNKYRNASIRWQNWDYGWNGGYFITKCTQNREYYFGEILNDKMVLSVIGQMANQYILEIPERFKYAFLDEFIVMPNHIHLIIVIDKKCGDKDCGDAIQRVPTTAKTGGVTGDKNPMLNDNVSRIMNWYSGRVTFESRKIDGNFGWQSRFHDHVIRNEAEYQRIKNYIINNPKNWNKDKLKGL